MPTGYTARLYEGEQSFEDYAMGAARAFGALVMMRDDPADAEIPEVFEPASYYVEAVATAKSELDAIANMSDGRLRKRQRDQIREAEQRRAEYIAEREARRQRYEAMLDEARAYTPPTADHEGYARFLIQQLEESLRFDCDGTYVPDVPARLLPMEYREQEIAKARERLARAERDLTEEQERADGRTEWVRALRESLKAESVDA